MASASSSVHVDGGAGTSEEAGVIYLLHFETKLAHAQHYIGWTRSSGTVQKRLHSHHGGTGARIMRAVGAASIRWWVVRLWDGDRNLERSLKRRRNASRFCPVCRDELDMTDLKPGPMGLDNLREMQYGRV